MNPAGAIVRGRRAAAALMTDACTITRPPTSPGALNQTTGMYATTGATSAYAGPCSVMPVSQAELERGEAQVELDAYTVDLPPATIVERDMLVTITASADPALVGRVLQIRTVTTATRTLYRRAVCEVIP